MNEFFTTLQKEARRITLSHDEKQSMRVRLYKMMDASPAYTAAQQEVLAEVASRRSTPSMYHWFSPRFMVPVAVLLVVGLSGGTAFAAQSALPGQPLYAVKVGVNEPVALALATTPAAKAEVNASIATTRLEEAESLASAGTLDATTTAELAGNFAQHAAEAAANTAEVAAADPGSAAQLATSFDSTLSAHVAILAQLGDDSASTSVKQNSDDLAMQALTEAVQDTSGDAAQGNPDEGTGVVLAVAPAAVSVDLSASATTTPATASDTAASSSAGVAPADASTTTPLAMPQAARMANMPASHMASSGQTGMAHVAQGSADDGTVALALATQASSTLAQVQSDFAALGPALDASTTAQIQSQINAAEALYVQGATALGANDAATAKDAFNKVLRLSTRLDAFLKAGKKFNVGLLTSLLK